MTTTRRTPLDYHTADGLPTCGADVAAYGPCRRDPGHTGDHYDANGRWFAASEQPHDLNDDGGLAWVWCGVEMAPATTRGGRCSGCGATDHDDLAAAQAAERAWIDGAE